MNEPRFKWEIAIAGLIHDIGKLYQKSDSNEVAGVVVKKNSAEHPLMAADFVDRHIKLFMSAPDLDVDMVKECATRHHSNKDFPEEVQSDKAPAQYKPYCKILDIADNLSSSERGRRGGKNRKELATLVPFFVRFKEAEPNPRKYAYKAVPYSSNQFKVITVKDSSHDPKEVDKFIEQFEKAVSKITANTKASLFNELNRVIREYTWCFPSSAVDEIRDVSLYQHLITTSAIATAIYSDLVACTTSEDEHFAIANVSKKDDSIKLAHIKLVGSDSFILNNKQTAFNMLDEISTKTLELDAMYNITIDKILEGMNLTDANKVISSGFESYILLGEQFEKKLIELLKDVNNELKDTYKGEIYLSYSIKDWGIGEDKMTVFSGEQEQLTNGLEDILKTGDTWNLDSFILKDTDNQRRKYEMYTEDIEESFHDFKNSIKEYGNKIAFIYVDGDKVLETMHKGFISEYCNNASISRVATYANILKTFFNEYVHSVFSENEHFISINANKFIIACSIQDVMGKVSDIKQMFDEYTMGTMTLSVAIAVYNIGERFSNIAEAGDRALRKAKELGGNRVQYKSLSLTDDDLDKYITISQSVYDSCGNTSAIRRLATYSGMYRDYLRTKDLTKLMCHPLYVKNRSKDTQQFGEELIEVLDKAFNDIFKGVKTVNKELYLLEDIIGDALIEKRMEGVG